MPAPTVTATDKWLDWLTNRRHGGNREIAEMTINGLKPIRDKLFEMIDIKLGDTVLDIGTGDGFIAIEAMKRVGPTGEVIFSDISQPSLDHCEAFVATLNEKPRTRFVNASAKNLAGAADASVDVITVRSVLIYEREKQQSFYEFFRVLKPGGFVTIFEPIARIYNSYRIPNHFLGYDLTEVKDIFPKLKEGFGASVGDDTPMSDFDDRDLSRMVLEAGFLEFKLETHTQLSEGALYAGSWDALYNSSPNPNSPSLKEALERSMTEHERERFINALRPKVEASERGRHAQAWCFLAAKKPIQ